MTTITNAVGSLFLPFLWLVNVIWFFKYAFSMNCDTDEAEDQRKELKKWVILSGIGTAAWMIILISWNAYFQTYRTSLDWADSWTYILPVGRP
jgi:presenilin enhancer 2